MSYYLLEIGVEELPAKYLDIAILSLDKGFNDLLKQNNIEFSNIESMGSPRRLYVQIKNLAEESSIVEKEIIGPPVNIVMDNGGQLNERGLKFIESKGIDKKNIKIIETAKGKYLGGIIVEHKISTKNLLLENLPDIIISIPFPKTMRWDNTNIRFARPIRWILSVYNGEALRFSLGSVDISNYTYGHRFMARGKIFINNSNEYFSVLKNAFVIVDKNERQHIIKNYIEDLSRRKNLSFNIDLDLLNTVSNLVEYPYPVVSTFDDKFLELPPEVLITSMKNHQKFFYLKDKNNNITNTFIGVSNTKPVDENIVAKGYARVLKARLTDALFFFNNDKTTPLISKLDKLKNIIFQEKLGSMYDKIERIRTIALCISHELDHKNNDHIINRIATLSKCDLLTEMVMEFPELQGIMGKIYASIQKEDPLVVNGIYEHYLPRFADDELPESAEGAIVSIADKVDTITGNFIIGNSPTGNVDPYGLRRKTIGIIEIFNKHNFDPDLNRIVSSAMDLYKSSLHFDYATASENIIIFMKQRLKQMLSNKGINPDVFEAVAGQYNRILLLKKAAKALNKFKSNEEFKNVALSYKRTNNILQKSNLLNNLDSINKDLFKSNFELNLYQMIEENVKIIPKKINEELFDDIFQNISQFSKSLNEFFDNVMVMDEDEQLRRNRLALLLSLKKCFNMVCDLSKLIY